MTNDIEIAAKRLMEADAIVILAGAGMGVDSGLPDFRGKEGFWEAYPMLKNHRLSFQDIANPESFKIRPTLAWGFYGHRLTLYRNTVPHNGFSILKAIAESKPDGYFVYTSNVDGQFQKAGFDDNRIVECHGSIHHLQYLDSQDGDKVISADAYEVVVNPETLRVEHNAMPTAKNGDLLRPNILMFNDWYWLETRTKEQEKRYLDWLESIKDKKVVVIEIGAGDAIATVRYQAQVLRRNHAQHLIQINPNPAKYADIVIADGALNALSSIQNMIA